MDPLHILVVILSVFLAVFLVVGIILAVILIQISKKIKEIANTAEQTVGKAHTFVGNVSTMTSPGAMFKVAQAFMQGFSRRR